VVIAYVSLVALFDVGSITREFNRRLIDIACCILLLLPAGLELPDEKKDQQWDTISVNSTVRSPLVQVSDGTSIFYSRLSQFFSNQA